MPPIVRSETHIFDCGVCADDTVARRRATRHRTHLGVIEARPESQPGFLLFSIYRPGKASPRKVPGGKTFTVNCQGIKILRPLLVEISLEGRLAAF